MPQNKIYVGDVGTIISCYVDDNISTGTYFALKIKKPVSNTEVVWVCNLSGLTNIEYEIIAGDFNEAGQYAVQSHVILPSGEWTGETTYIQVYDEYE